ncbi:MAG: DUF1501 domain-containing protein [Planctomycetes bacterium]|nr:DUF1501 domain-containing protein [Planctomycetota bacterium]
MQDRRDFLKSTSLLSAGAIVPTFLARTALAAPNSSSATGGKDTILVVVQLTGGNDGLNTVIPFKNDLYAKYRPTLKIPVDRIRKVDDSFGLHPSLAGLHGLLEDKALAIIHGVGYPNPSQSHFRSMDIWQAASLKEKLTEGWIGKSLKQMNAPAFHVANQNESAPLALTGSPARVPSITSIEDFQLKMTAATGADKKDQKTLIEDAARVGKKPGLLDFVSKTALNTYAASQKLQEIGKNYQPKSPYPQNNALGNRLKLCAQLIDAGMGARIFYVAIDGFDTHANQGGVQGAHANLLTQVSEAIAAFYKDLAARGHKDRLMVMTFSEFGRRAKENGSRGTDHGSGAPMFLVGGQVKPGLIGEHPDMEKLDFGNLKHTVDFRQVYAAVLEQWLGVNSKDVLDGEFKAIDVLE